MYSLTTRATAEWDLNNLQQIDHPGQTDLKASFQRPLRKMHSQSLKVEPLKTQTNVCRAIVNRP